MALQDLSGTHFSWTILEWLPFFLTKQEQRGRKFSVLCVHEIVAWLTTRDICLEGSSHLLLSQMATVYVGLHVSRYPRDISAIQKRTIILPLLLSASINTVLWYLFKSPLVGWQKNPFPSLFFQSWVAIWHNSRQWDTNDLLQCLEKFLFCLAQILPVLHLYPALAAKLVAAAVITCPWGTGSGSHRITALILLSC